MRERLEKDPAALAAYAGKLPTQKRVLGVDLGTNCGVAWADISKGKAPQIVAGQWDLSLGPYDTGPLRHIRLKQFLSVLQPDLIGFEDVKFTPDKAMFGGKGVSVIVARVANASELLGGFKITLTTWAEERGIPAEGFAIGEIKKYATGKGNAGKPEMIKAANEKYGAGLKIEDFESTGADNIADAIHICAMTIERYLEGLD